MSKGLEAFDNIKWEVLEWTEGYEEDLHTIEKELKAFEIIREIVKENVSNWGNVDFNINDYPLLKEVLL